LEHASVISHINYVMYSSGAETLFKAEVSGSSDSFCCGVMILVDT